MNKTKGCLIANFATVPRDEQQHQEQKHVEKKQQQIEQRPRRARSHRISRKIRLKWPSCTSGRAVFLPDRRRGFFLPEPHADLPPRTPRGGFFSPRSSIAASDDAETTRPRTSSCSIAIADDGTRSPAVATDLELASPHPTMRAGVDHRQV
ncbi:hypothetical protein KS931_29615 (plasmid) [Klebsiella pneumoniae]|nr:hypothetical protein [Klebsiella pneumoniae]MBV7403111.1 hypothetical protein [Klebsiella pneumoniae]